MNAEEMLDRIRFLKKVPMVTAIEGYLDEGVTEPTLKDIYMLWRDAILANGHIPSRYLYRPIQKDLNNIESIRDFFLQNNSIRNLPHFFNSIFANFDEVVTYAKKNDHQFPFEVHQLGMFLYVMPQMLEWYYEVLLKRRGLSA